jgi:hypothetical protein
MEGEDTVATLDGSTRQNHKSIMNYRIQQLSGKDNPAEYTCISKFSMEVAAVKKETKYKRLLRSSGRTKMLSCRYLN